MLGPHAEAGFLAVAALSLARGWRAGSENLWVAGRYRCRWLAAGLLATSAVVRTIMLGVFSEPTESWLVAADLSLLAGALLLMAGGLRLTREVEVDNGQGGLLDELTGTASHRGFQDRLVHESERVSRLGDTFALLLVDLDGFQLVNNRFGHKTGDRVLVELAARLRPMVREIDLCARFGGDQFALILPHTLERGAANTAERVRKSIAAWSFSGPQGAEIGLTASVGLALYPQDAQTPPELVEAAKRCVSLAKTLGGNQLQLARELPQAAEARISEIDPASERDPGTTVRSLAAAVDVRDRYTHSHSHLVSELAGATARALGMNGSEVGLIRVGALLHDVGKIGIPDAILTKEGPLTAEEWAIIREHPLLGKRIIEQSQELGQVVPLVLHHQERYDGGGYPVGLAGERIPLGARIIAAADAYHAIRSDRPYRGGRSHEEAVEELWRCVAGQFDPAVVAALVRSLELDPSLQLMRNPCAERSDEGLRDRGEEFKQGARRLAVVAAGRSAPAV